MGKKSLSTKFNNTAKLFLECIRNRRIFPHMNNKNGVLVILKLRQVFKLNLTQYFERLECLIPTSGKDTIFEVSPF